jgi:hypothetical protein
MAPVQPGGHPVVVRRADGGEMVAAFQAQKNIGR